MMRSAWALALVLLFVPVPTAQAETADAQWWPPGQTEPGQGFHLRVPVAVTNDLGYVVSNGVVAAELDLRAKLVEAGWIHSGSGGTESLKGFHLDPNSIRVVAMRADGTLRAVEPSYTKPQDPQRYEVPSVVFDGRLSGSDDHDPFVNPVVTVVWRVAGNLTPRQTQHFMVYFDNDLTNVPPHEPASYDGLLAGGDVESLFWSGPAVSLHGIVRPVGGPGVIEVIGTQPNTQVRVFAGTPGGTLSPVLVGSSPLFTLEAGQSRQVTLPSTALSAVRVVADRPVLAEGTSTGFVPSVDGGMAGREFLFSMRHGPSWRQDTIHFTQTGNSSTVVKIERLDAPMAPLLFDLADKNPNPYTTGWRENMQSPGCNAPDPSSPKLPDGPGFYRARVISGSDRVLLQLQPVDGLSQAPSKTGAPAGDRLWAAVDWTTIVQQYVDGRVQCFTTPRPISWFAGAAEEVPTTIRVTSPDRPYQITPRGDTRFTPAPIGLVGGAAVDGPFEATLADRPLLFNASAPVHLFVGPYGAQTGPDDQAPTVGGQGIPVAHGPFGGSGAGRSFMGLGASIVFAPFDDTKVKVDVDYQRIDGSKEAALSAGSTFIIADRSAQDPVRSFSLQSTRPVLVYPLAATAGFFAGVPAFLHAEAGKAEYRGYLVGLRSVKGEDPVIESTAPGVAVTFDLEVTNLGRRAGGLDLLDNIEVSIDDEDLPATWETTTSLAGSASLHSKEKTSFKVTLRPPSTAESGDFEQVTVRASSKGNPLVEDTLQLGVFVKKDYAVGLWFDDVPKPGDPGVKRKDNNGVNGVYKFNLVLQNTGSVRDTYAVTARQGSTSPWSTQLVLEGREVDSFELDPREVARFELRAVPPSADAGKAVITVEAISGIVPSVFDRVTAVANSREAVALRIESEDDFRLVEPGKNATFNLTLINDGGSGDISPSLQSTPGGGWGKPRLWLGDTDVTGSNNLKINQTGLALRVVVQAPREGLAGATFILRFGAKPAQGDGVEALFTAKVKAMHRVTTAVDGLPLAIETLGNATHIEARLTNRGNLDEFLNVSAADLPAGWSLRGPPDVFVGRNATKVTHLNLTAPAGTPPGLYNVTIRLTARDGNRTLVPLPVVVGLVPGQRLGGLAGKAVQPGEVAHMEAPLSNEGNTPLRVRAQAQEGDSWGLLAMPDLVLLPGETTTLVLRWTVPAAAPDGPSTHAATLVMTPDGGGEPVVQTVQGQFEVARADLAVVSASAVPAPGGTLVRAVLENTGRRPARDFVVDLVVEGETVDRLPVGELPAGGSVEISFLQTSPGVGVIRADGNGTVVESGESNNLREVAGGAEQPAPGLGFAALAGILAVAVAVLRRGRP